MGREAATGLMGREVAWRWIRARLGRRSALWRHRAANVD
jgi:hypothetical protein